MIISNRKSSITQKGWTKSILDLNIQMYYTLTPRFWKRYTTAILITALRFLGSLHPQHNHSCGSISCICPQYQELRPNCYRDRKVKPWLINNWTCVHVGDMISSPLKNHFGVTYLFDWFLWRDHLSQWFKLCKFISPRIQ